VTRAGDCIGGRFAAPPAGKRALVNWVTASMILAVPGCAIYVIAVRRSIKRLRAGDEEWRRRWRQLDRRRRR
jgi:hypothetical protein